MNILLEKNPISKIDFSYTKSAIISGKILNLNDWVKSYSIRLFEEFIQNIPYYLRSTAERIEHIEENKTCEGHRCIPRGNSIVTHLKKSTESFKSLIC